MKSFQVQCALLMLLAAGLVHPAAMKQQSPVILLKPPAVLDASTAPRYGLTRFNPLGIAGYVDVERANRWKNYDWIGFDFEHLRVQEENCALVRLCNKGLASLTKRASKEDDWQDIASDEGHQRLTLAHHAAIAAWRAQERAYQIVAAYPRNAALKNRFFPTLWRHTIRASDAAVWAYVYALKKDGEKALAQAKEVVAEALVAIEGVHQELPSFAKKHGIPVRKFEEVTYFEREKIW